MQGIAFLLLLQHTCIGGAELCFVKSLSEAFASLSHLLLYFLVILGYLVLYQHVGAIAFF